MDPHKRVEEAAKNITPPGRNYMKWWRLIRRWAKAKSGLTLTDIELLLYLRSIPYFDREDFNSFCMIISVNYNKITDLRRHGWIQVFKKRNGRQKTIYQLSHKARALVDQIYAYLEGEEMPERAPTNPLYMKDSTYSERKSRIMVEVRNREIREQRRHRAQRSQHIAPRQ